MTSRKSARSYRSRFGRTVLEAENVWFALLTKNTNPIPIHFDADY